MTQEEKNKKWVDEIEEQINPHPLKYDKRSVVNSPRTHRNG